MSISIQSRKGQKLSGQNLYFQTSKRRSSLAINPDIINYIQKVQKDQDKDKSKQSEQNKNSNPNQYERMMTQKIKKQTVNPVFKEDMTADKDKRFNAKKGLLFLLNNLSKGTFCPDIEEYFKKMKEKKVQEFKNKINDDINNYCAAPKRLRRLRLGQSNFIGALRSRLLWGEDVRNGGQD